MGGDGTEEIVELVNAKDRALAAISLPAAAGLDPLDPLATAPHEARPFFAPTLPPAWTALHDDRVFHACNHVPKRNCRVAAGAKASIAGSFTPPPRAAEAMYQAGIHGASA